MATGIVSLKLMLSDKQFKSQMNRAVDKVKSTVGQMKNIMVAAALGQYLFAGANDAIDAAVDQVKTKLNLIQQGLTELQVDPIMQMAETFELMGYNAEQAGNSIADFIVTGKSMGLKSIGVMLDKQTQSMLMAATATERYEWALANLPTYLQGMTDMLPDNIENMIKMRKTMDDLKEAMGTTFLTVIQKITDAFGGIIPAMKAALIAFTAYKSAMIIGNVAIGISKAIAVGTVFAAPVAFAMGASALLALGALIGGASLAIGAMNDIGTPESTNKTPDVLKPDTIVVVRDKFGETSKSISESSGGSSSNVQTNYGGS